MISLLTYNIHKGFSVGKLRFVLPKMRTVIEEISPDFVFLQEVQGEHKKQEKRIQSWPEKAQFDFIAEAFWPHVAYAKNAIYSAGHHGNAILSKHPIVSHENINVSNISRASRSLLHGIIQPQSWHTPLHLLNVHLGLFRAERKEQMQTLVERITSVVPLSEPLLMAGDFNDWRMEVTNVLESELGLKEVFRELEGNYAKSFPALRPALRTDRIYYRGINLVKGECFSGKPWRLLSDHLPLFASFEP